MWSNVVPFSAWVSSMRAILLSVKMLANRRCSLFSALPTTIVDTVLTYLPTSERKRIDFSQMHALSSQYVRSFPINLNANSATVRWVTTRNHMSVDAHKHFSVPSTVRGKHGTHTTTRVLLHHYHHHHHLATIPQRESNAVSIVLSQRLHVLEQWNKAMISSRNYFENLDGSTWTKM